MGGFEIAALAGAYLACAQQGVAVLVDGFICSVAALVAVRLNPQCRAWLLFAHQGAEPGHKALLDALQAEPLLALGLRLGEGSGAALAVPLLRLACVLHGQMATFAEAAVADRPA
ncbi:Nicotinate-nucleotide--dimethylbenzimidazole phosphoribosyltransferase [compost metagenome]